MFNTASDEHGCMATTKIDRLIEKYELVGMEQRLVREWTRETDRRKSIRELTTLFNTELLTDVLDDHTHGMVPAEYSIEAMVTRLRARDSEAAKYDDVPDREITDVVEWLRDNGVPVDELTDDFVSRGTMHTYLKDIKAADSPAARATDLSPDERRQEAIEGVRRDMEGRLDRIERRLRTLQTHDQLPEPEPDVEFSADCYCPNCGHGQPIVDYIENRGCSECEFHIRNREPDE
jgi:hypothetical protein